MNFLEDLHSSKEIAITLLGLYGSAEETASVECPKPAPCNHTHS